MKTRLKQGFTLIELLVVITIIAILASLALPAFNGIQERGNITKGINNCRQIITSMKVYATDNNGAYPDAIIDEKGKSAPAKDANEAFRQLFSGGIIADEKIFSCPAGYGPTGNVGVAPDYKAALGTCHWEMAVGLSDSSSSAYPVVWENSTDNTWDPKWDVKSVSKIAPGRVWSGPKIILGFNDASVSATKVETTGQLKKPPGATLNAFKNAVPTGGDSPKVLKAVTSSSST